MSHGIISPNIEQTIKSEIATTEIINELDIYMNNLSLEGLIDEQNINNIKNRIIKEIEEKNLNIISHLIKDTKGTPELENAARTILRDMIEKITFKNRETEEVSYSELNLLPIVLHFHPKKTKEEYIIKSGISSFCANHVKNILSKYKAYNTQKGEVFVYKNFFNGPINEIESAPLLIYHFNIIQNSLTNFECKEYYRQPEMLAHFDYSYSFPLFIPILFKTKDIEQFLNDGVLNIDLKNGFSKKEFNYNNMLYELKEVLYKDLDMEGLEEDITIEVKECLPFFETMTKTYFESYKIIFQRILEKVKEETGTRYKNYRVGHKEDEIFFILSEPENNKAAQNADVSIKRHFPNLLIEDEIYFFADVIESYGYKFTEI